MSAEAIVNEAASLVAAIEAGGTKFNLALGTGPDDLRATARIPTTAPGETMAAVIDWLGVQAREHGPFRAIGVGSFGPVDLDPESPAYGRITTTPKPGWQQAPFVAPLRDAFGVPVGFDTDVNAAALGESLWGAGRGLDPLLYLTIGTGVGGGVIVHGRPLHGVLHPEIGHLQVPAPAGSGAPDARCQCPFHDSCLEGFVSGPAIAARWGVKPESLPRDHPAIGEIALTLARGLASLIVTLAPQRIILGGGVMHLPGLIEQVRQKVIEILNGYLHVPEIRTGIRDYIVPPGLGDRSGVLGALVLGINALP